jgi:hypothetical protein
VGEESVEHTSPVDPVPRYPGPSENFLYKY